MGKEDSNGSDSGNKSTENYDKTEGFDLFLDSEVDPLLDAAPTEEPAMIMLLQQRQQQNWHQRKHLSKLSK